MVCLLKEEGSNLRKIFITLLINYFIFGMVANVWSSAFVLDELNVSMKKDSPEKNTTDDKSETATLFKQFSRNLDLDITSNYSYFFESVSEKDDHDLEIRSNFSSWAGNKEQSFHFSGWFENGTQKDTYAGITRFLRDEERERRIVEINELYGVVDTGEIELTAGKKILPFNTNSIYPLSGFYHPLDLNVPTEARILGLWQVSADVTIKETDMSAYIFPVFQDHKTPSSQSRWMPNSDYDIYWYEDEFGLSAEFNFIREFLLYYFGDTFELNDVLKDLLDNEDVIIINDLPQFKLDEIGYGGEIKTSYKDIDLFGNFYYGPNPYPVIRIVDRGSHMEVIKNNPQVWRLATGGTATWRDFEFHTEIMYNAAVNGTDDDYISYTGGFTYTSDFLASLMRIDTIQTRLNYSGETITDKQDHDEYYFSSKDIRQFRNDILFNLTAQINDDINFFYLLDANLDDSAWYHRIAGSYRLYPGIVAECFVELFSGGSDSFISSWKENSRAGLKMQWTF